MKQIKSYIDEHDPWLSVRLRVLQKRLRHDYVGPLIQRMLGRGEVGVDVGANRGIYTYVMSVRVGGTGRVHAIEPFPENCARLQTVARHRGNITVHPLAVSDRLGSGVLRIPVHQGQHLDELASLEPRESPGEDNRTVSLSTLDELLAQERRVSLIKCDVEGHEQRVLEGATRILSRDKPTVIIEVEQRHREDPIDNTFMFFADTGYSGWFISQDGVRPLEEFSLVRDQLDFLDGHRYLPHGMPGTYVNNFLFCPAGIVPPLQSRGGHSGCLAGDLAS
jgi:FkbM family methyltransferase